jgi:Trypsin-like peptidase domain
MEHLLAHHTPDELLAELRARETLYSASSRPLHDFGAFEPPTPLPCGPPGLRDVPSKVLYEALILFQITTYGADDRREIYCNALSPERGAEPAEAAQPDIPAEALRAADSVVALFHESHVRDNADGTMTLETLPFGIQRGLCSDERFADQPAGAFGTGFLVAPTLVATAGHCADHCEEGAMRIVLGFRMISPRAARLIVDVREVFGVARCIAKVYDPHGPDWALLELDRPVFGRAPLPVRRRGRIADGAPVYTLGHPCGLPLKYADNAHVRDNAPDAYFVANLDTYAGCSGSPVLGPDHVVEGLIARGERDFVRVGNCYRSLVVPDNGGRGQDCVRITSLVELIP